MFPKFVRPLTATLLILLVFSTACRGPLGLNGTGGSPFGGGSTSGSVQTASPVKNLVVLVFQNRSFDHLFQKYTPAAGQTIDVAHPGVLGFTQTDANGASFTPFLLSDPFSPDLVHGRNFYLASWDTGLMDGFVKANGSQTMGYFDASTPGLSTLFGYANSFALADEYFSSVLSSAPAQMMYAVSADDHNQPFSTQPVFGPCQSSDPAAFADTAPNIGDELSGQGIGWTWFQENYGVCGTYVPQQNPFQYFTSTNNGPHIQDYQVFLQQLNSNTLPSVSFVQMNPSHSGHPGSSTITAAISFLDNFVKSAQSSSSWNQMAIAVIWDEGGGWYDHVPPPQIDTQGLGIRVPLLVISPLAKKGVVVHDVMDHTSILKFIQWNWGLPPLNSRNSDPTVGDMRTMFTF